MKNLEKKNWVKPEVKSIPIKSLTQMNAGKGSDSDESMNMMGVIS